MYPKRSISDIARTVGCSRQAVYLQAKRAGIRLTHGVNLGMRAKVVAEYSSSKITVPELAAKYGKNTSYVYDALREDGVKIERRMKGRASKPILVGEQVRYITRQHQVRKAKGAPSRCDLCGDTSLTARNYSWINTGGPEYNPESYVRLCRQCTMRYACISRSRRWRLDKQARLQLIKERVDSMKAQGKVPSFTDQDANALFDGDDSRNWPGEKALYVGYQQRVQEVRGKPCRCDLCGNANRAAKDYGWVSVAGRRDDPDDYVRLCVWCRMRYASESSSVNWRPDKQARLQLIKKRIDSLKAEGRAASFTAQDADALFNALDSGNP